MHIAQLFFHNSILIASRTTDFWCFLKELAGLHRILIGFCDLFRKILLKREKAARINQKTAKKQAAWFLSPACFDMFEPSKAFSMFLFMMPANQNANTAQLRLKSEKSTRINQKNAQKTGSTISFACLLWYVWAIKDVFHVSVCDTSESSANDAQLRLKSEKSTRINQKTAQKQAARFLSPACFGMFEPSKTFSMFLFMMPANQAASHCNQNQNANDQRCHLPVAFP